jgi:hypothetical protein
MRVKKQMGVLGSIRREGSQIKNATGDSEEQTWGFGNHRALCITVLIDDDCTSRLNWRRVPLISSRLL